jgi:hypothetical protein
MFGSARHVRLLVAIGHPRRACRYLVLMPVVGCESEPDIKRGFAIGIWPAEGRAMALVRRNQMPHAL